MLLLAFWKVNVSDQRLGGAVGGQVTGILITVIQSLNYLAQALMLLRQ